MSSAVESTVVFYAPCPHVERLVCFQLRFHRPGDEAAGRQVLRCRELIFSCDSVIASPVTNGDTILVVSLPANGALEQLFSTMKAEVLTRQAARRHEFESCLRYTLRAKLAPQWNKVGPLLIHGRNFLSQSGSLSAVKLNITVSDGDVCLSAEACRVRLPPLTLNDMAVTPSVLNHFLSGNTDVINDRQINSRWCFNLPGMRKGQLTSVTKAIPAVSPFNSYRDLKRYWKNMYGYRLDEQPPLYYMNINFRPVGSHIFTYPPQCLRSANVVYMARPDPRPILTALLRDIHLKCVSVCDTRLVFSGRPSRLSTVFYPSSQAGDYGRRAADSNVQQTDCTGHPDQLAQRQRGLPQTVADNNHRCSGANISPGYGGCGDGFHH